MQSATLPALERRTHDQLGHGGEVSKLEQIARHGKVPVVGLDFLLQISDAGQGTFQALVGADDTDVVPHQSSEFVPVVSYDHHLVGIGGAAGMPFRQFGGGWFCRVREHVPGGAVGVDKRLE